MKKFGGSLGALTQNNPLVHAQTPLLNRPTSNTSTHYITASRFLKTIIWPLPPKHGTPLADRPANVVNQGLRHSLAAPLGTPAATNSTSGPNRGARGGRLAAHGGENIVACRQADEQRKRDEPDTDAKVGRNLGEGRDVVGGVVVRGHVLVGALLAVGEVPEPDVMVQQDENCRRALGLAVFLRSSQAMLPTA